MLGTGYSLKIVERMKFILNMSCSLQNFYILYVIYFQESQDTRIPPSFIQDEISVYNMNVEIILFLIFEQTCFLSFLMTIILCAILIISGYYRIIRNYKIFIFNSVCDC